MQVSSDASGCSFANKATIQLIIVVLLNGWQDRYMYARVAIGENHQCTAATREFATWGKWASGKEDILILEHPSLEHTTLSVEVNAERTLLPDKLLGTGGNMVPLCC